MVSSPTLSRNDLLWNFAYYSGCGNLFLIAFDPEDVQSKISTLERATLCTTLNVVVDGLLFLGKNSKMHYYNRDGSRAPMCGNGLRCLGHFAHTLDPSETFSIETDLGPRSISIQKNGLVMTDMGRKPTITQPIDTWFFCNTGVPHAVQFLKTLPHGPIEDMLRPVRYNPAFGTNGTNVSLAMLDETGIHLRTYERGVEQETGACGTGACAAAVIASEVFGASFPHKIHFQSGEEAFVSMKNEQLFLTAGCQVLDQYTLPNPLRTNTISKR